MRVTAKTQTKVCLLGLLILAPSACGVPTPTPQVVPTRLSCAPNQRASCGCFDGKSGEQTCRPDGAFSPCVCQSQNKSEQLKSNDNPVKPMIPAPEIASTPEETPKARELQPPTCPSSGNVMILSGDEGDYITQGRLIRFAGNFIAGVSVGGHALQVDARGESGDQLDRASFSLTVARTGTQLHRGRYAQLFRDEKAKSNADFSVSYSTRACGAATALINIQELRWDNEKVTKFVATFEQYCGGGSVGLHGCIHLENVKSGAKSSNGKKTNVDFSY